MSAITLALTPEPAASGRVKLMLEAKGRGRHRLQARVYNARIGDRVVLDGTATLR